MILAALVLLFNALARDFQFTRVENANTGVIRYGYWLENGSHKANLVGTDTFAGVVGKKITDIAIQAVNGTVSYQVHYIGGNWLPPVTGYDWNDDSNGYAGVHKPIDLIRVTSSLCVPKYRVAPVGRDYYGWQYGDQTTNGQDGYAGDYGKAIDRFQIVCSDQSIVKPNVTGKDPNVYMKQRNSGYPQVVKEGCLYLSCCYMAGFNTIQQADAAFDWACTNDYVRRSDSAVITWDRPAFANAMAKKFGTTFRSGLDIQYSGKHWYVFKNGVEVYNSVYIGYR